MVNDIEGKQRSNSFLKDLLVFSFNQLDKVAEGSIHTFPFSQCEMVGEFLSVTTVFVECNCCIHDRSWQENDQGVVCWKRQGRLYAQSDVGNCWW